MIWPAIIGGIASVAGSFLSGQSDSPPPIQRVDFNKMIQMASDQARRNIRESMQLEQEFDPATFQARTGAMQALLGDVEKGGVDYTDLESRLMAELDKGDMALEAPELEESALLESAREKALADLELGYELPQDVRNLVMRTAAGRTSGAGTIGRAGRDIGARDLGLTSLDIFDRRMDRASGLGFQQEQTNLAQQGLKANIAQQNRVFSDARTRGLIGQIGNMRQQGLTNRLGLAQFTQGIARPQAGIDPGSLASAYVADINSYNQFLQGQPVGNSKAGAGAALGTAGSIISGFCWVAQEVYPDDRWKLFRLWMVNESDDRFFNWYVRYGERFAAYLREHPALKPAIKSWMDKKIASIRGKDYSNWIQVLTNRLGE